MKRALAFGLVTGQVLLLVALLILPHGTVWPVNGFVIATSVTLVVGGIALAVRGSATLGPAMTASPIPRENTPLATDGLPHHSQPDLHRPDGRRAGPGTGRCVVPAHPDLVRPGGPLSGKARWEERMLADEHPAYSEYAARVGRFLPGPGRIR
jgi:protein-S-isoprenylcysteine O-methyltransferase Ste14